MLRAVWLGVTLSYSLLSQTTSVDLRHALSLFNSGQYERCYQELSSYIKENPDSGVGFKFLGMTEFMLGQPEQARAHLTLAKNLSPKDSEAFYYLGRLEFTADNPVAAAEDYQKALDLDPSSVRAENQLGQCFEAVGRPSEAEAAYRKAIELEQGQPKKSEWPFYNLGLLYLHEGKSKDSIAYFRRALEYNPGFVNAKVKLAVALATERQDDEAQNLLRDAIRIEANNAEAHYRLAIVLQKIGKHQEADQQFALFEKYQKP